MKNIMKKLFSLLLVGVVAVSMFGFITPNNVDAAETNGCAGKIVISCVPVPDTSKLKKPYKVCCMVRYYNVYNKEIVTPMIPCSETLHGGESRTYDIRDDVQRITIYTYFVGVDVFPTVKSYYERVPGEKPNPTEQSILYTIRSPFDPKSPGFNEKVGNGWHANKIL